MLDEAGHKDAVKDSLGGGSHDVACGDDGWSLVLTDTAIVTNNHWFWKEKINLKKSNQK